MEKGSKKGQVVRIRNKSAYVIESIIILQRRKWKA
jgi:hypothetical protein